MNKYAIADMHCDTVIPIQRGHDIGKRNAKNHVDIPRLKDGGVALQMFACTSVHAENETDHFNNVNRQIDLLKREFSKNVESIEICTSSTDITRVISKGKIAAILAVEGGQALASNPTNIEHFYNRGIRLVTIAHELPLGWCACHKESDSKSRGLNALGMEIIAEMNRLGIIIDISHSGEKTIEDILTLSSAPVIASHSNARAMCNHTRNLPNMLIKAIAQSGGLIGVTFVNNFISEKYDNAYEQFWSTVPPDMLKSLLKLYSADIPERKYNETLQRDFKFILEGEKSYSHLRPSITEVADHLDYIVNLAGVDHVGIGSDFDGISATPFGLEDCSKFPNLTGELILRDYAENDIINILHGNFIRLFTNIVG